MATSFRCLPRVILLLFFTFWVGVKGQGRPIDRYPCITNPEPKHIQQNADFQIGVILNAHEVGSGLSGCGGPSAPGVRAFESLRVIIQEVNRRPMSTDDDSRQTALPGMTLGLKVYDSCSHPRSSVDQLTNLFPILKGERESCQRDINNNSLLIGAIDLTGVTFAPDVSQALREYSIPFLSVVPDFSLSSSPHRVAKILLEVSLGMEWTKISIFYAPEDSTNSNLVDSFKQLIDGRGQICVVRWIEIPDSKRVRSTLLSLNDSVDDNSAVIVIGNGPAIDRLLTTMGELPEITSKLQWLFTSVPEGSSLVRIRQTLSKSRLFSLSPYPGVLTDLESRWTRVPSTAIPNDAWLAELNAVELAKCAGSTTTMTSDFACDIDTIQSVSRINALRRSSTYLPIEEAVETYVASLGRAWLDLCQGQLGVCPMLSSIDNHLFVSKYFAKPEKVEEPLKLALTRYTLENERIVFNQVAVYTTETSVVLDNTFRYMPSKCAFNNCQNCIRGAETSFNNPQEAASTVRQSRKKSQSTKISGDEGDFVIPLLLSIRGPGKSPLECGTELDVDAIQDLEGALWIVDRINSDESFLQGARLGIRVIDTCSSPTKIARGLSALLEEPTASEEDGSFPQVLTVISSLSARETAVAGAILSLSNVTIITARSVSTDSSFENNSYVLRIPGSSITKARAVVDLIGSFGWEYISIVYGNEVRYRTEVETLKKGLKSAGICVAEETIFSNDNIEIVDRVVQQLFQSRDRGARGVLLITDTLAVRALLSAVKESNKKNDFVWLASGQWTHDLAVVKGLEETARGAVLFSPAQSSVAEFVSYFKRLKPENNRRNPFFADYFKQNVECKDIGCDPNANGIRYRPSLSVGYTMQAILSVAAALARARNELCGVDTRGLCPRLLLESHLREVFNHYLRYTASVRPDGKGEMFSFTKEGYGNTDVDLFNFRRATGGSYIYQKVGSYKNQLSSLLPIVAYDVDGREMATERLPSKCSINCSACHNPDKDLFFVESPDELYLAASFDLHEPSEHPLQCGAKISSTGIRRLEAFLWALDKANRDVLRQDLTLGAVVFDACSSPPKSARDLSNYISRSSKLNGDLKLPFEVVDGTLALLSTAGSSRMLRPLLGVTVPLGIPTLSLASTGFPLDDMASSTHLLRYSLPEEAWARATVNLMKTYRWSYVSLVKSKNSGNGFHQRIYELISESFAKNGVRLATVEDIPQNGDSGVSISSVEQVLNSLTKNQKDGARVVLLLTNSEDTEALLSSTQRFQKRGLFQPSNFLFVGYDNFKIFQKYPEQTLGALSIRASVHQETSFVQHFSKLTLNGNSTKNPWFKSYWEQEHSCRGSACNSKSNPGKTSLHQPDPMVTNVIQSVLSVATAASSVWKHECRDRKNCLRDGGRRIFREKVFKRTKEVVLIRPDGSETAFGNDNYIKGKLDILNFRQIGSHSLAFVTVGSYSEDFGLSMNSSNVLAYGIDKHEYPMSELSSRCLNGDACLRRAKSSRQSLMYVNRNEKVFLGALFPVHNEGSSLFKCGQMGSTKMFHNIIALVYSLSLTTKVGGYPRMGAVIFDDCSQEQRAEQKIYSFFAEQAHSDASPNLISMLAYNDDISVKVRPILEAKGVPLIVHPTPSRSARSSNNSPSALTSLNTIRTIPSSKTQMDAVISILVLHGWRYVYVIHADNPFGSEASSHFASSAKDHNICVAEKVSFKTDTSIRELGRLLRRSFVDTQPRVAVLITEDPFVTRLVLRAAKESSLLSRFVWIGTEGWADDLKVAEILEGSNAEAITVSEMNPTTPGVQEFYANLTLTRHEPIPDDWFEEYWQRRFECRLSESTVVQLRYPEQCTGLERLQPETMVTKDVYPTIATVNSISATLKEYYGSGKCPNGVGDCDVPPEKTFVSEVRRRLMKSTGERQYNIYHLGNRTDGSYSYVRVATWKEGSSELPSFPVSFLGGLPSSICRGGSVECSKCAEQFSSAHQLSSYSSSASHPEQGPIYANFQTVWGIVATALSVLGIVLVIICAFYFLMAFPVTVGTTVLGYKILFGLLILYGVNFSFILSATESTCGVRRFVMGLAYSIIFSGLLIKVTNTWRLMGYSGNRMMNDPNRMSSPAGLLVVSVGLVLVQIVLTAAWLILMPPKIGFYRDSWRCAPPNSFEDELVVSLIYVMLILAVTILFSVLTWKCRENGQESRWILACCVFVGLVWLVWTVLGTQLPPRYRDATIVVANLLCATLVMLCLYMRKVYVYSKLSRQMRRRDLKAHLKGPQYQHSMYGTLQKNLAAVAPVLCGSQASLTGKSFYGGHFGHVELDEAQSETCGSTSSAGSVQVQGTDLYPLEMYDGGSHMSLYGTKSALACVNENINYERS